MVRRAALDLGTRHVRLAVPGCGVVVDEPSVVAVSSRRGSPVVLGRRASEMVGRAPGYVALRRPMIGGELQEEGAAALVVRAVLDQAGLLRRRRPRLVACVAAGATGVERRAMTEACQHAGAGEVSLLDRPVAAAVGLGLPLERPQGTMVVDVGAGATEAAVVVLGEVVVSRRGQVGAEALSAAVAESVRSAAGVVVSPEVADELTRLLLVEPTPGAATVVEVDGRDRETGAAAKAVVTREEVAQAVAGPLAEIEQLVRTCLAATPPELSEDLIESGLHLVGGGALVGGVDRRLQRTTGLPVRLAPSARTVAVEGAARCAAAESGFLARLPATPPGPAGSRRRGGRRTSATRP